MVAETVVALISSFSYQSFWQTIRPLLFFITGIVVYSIFIFKFYRFVAKKELFELDYQKYKPGGFEGFLDRLFETIGYISKYFVAFPLFLFFWFIVLTSLLIFLSKNTDTQQIMLISIGLIGAIRATAYYNEDLSKDLAKMIPFALLGIFLVDTSYFSQVNSLDIILQLPTFWRTMVVYLLSIVVIECVLRLASYIWSFVPRKEKTKDIRD